MGGGGDRRWLCVASAVSGRPTPLEQPPGVGRVQVLLWGSPILGPSSLIPVPGPQSSPVPVPLSPIFHLQSLVPQTPVPDPPNPRSLVSKPQPCSPVPHLPSPGSPNPSLCPQSHVHKHQPLSLVLCPHAPVLVPQSLVSNPMSPNPIPCPQTPSRVPKPSSLILGPQTPSLVPNPWSLIPCPQTPSLVPDPWCPIPGPQTPSLVPLPNAPLSPSLSPVGAPSAPASVSPATVSLSPPMSPCHQQPPSPAPGHGGRPVTHGPGSPCSHGGAIPNQGTVWGGGVTWHPPHVPVPSLGVAGCRSWTPVCPLQAWGQQRAGSGPIEGWGTPGPRLLVPTAPRDRDGLRCPPRDLPVPGVAL